MEETFFQRKRKLIYLAVFISFILAFLVLSNPEENLKQEVFEGKIEVHFIDVGQADATLIKTENTKVLVDAGHWQRTDVLDYLNENNIEKIDLLIGTHPHADHIGQFDIILQEIQVTEVWMSGFELDSATYRRTIEAIDSSQAIYREPRTGQEYQLNDLNIYVLNPEKLTRDIHETSISIKVEFGEFSIILTGDAEKQTEEKMVRENRQRFVFLNSILPERFQRNFENKLDTLVYQVGHHGSDTSSTRIFLEAMSPKIAIYSAGEGNPYDHPTPSVVERFNDMNIPLYGTDKHGTIIIKSDHTGEIEIYLDK